MELKKWVEALLFASGRYMTLAELLELCTVEELGLIREAVKELRDDLERGQSPLTVVGAHDAWKLSVVQAYLPVVEGIMPEMELDKPLLETLAVIAWRQPILQSEVIKIRSTTAYDHIQELLDKNFITRARYGRSYVLKTTKQFEEYFELPGKEAAKSLFAGIEGELEKSMKRKERVGDLTIYRAKEASAQKQEKEGPHVEFYFDDAKKQQEQSEEEREQEAKDQERKEDDGGFGLSDENAGEQGLDDEKAKRIIEELAREDEPEDTDGDEQGAFDEEEDILHPALERFASKVPLPKMEVKKETGAKSKKSGTQTGADEEQDGPEEEKE